MIIVVETNSLIMICKYLLKYKAKKVIYRIRNNNRQLVVIQIRIKENSFRKI
jgi:hypothetical protein